MIAGCWACLPPYFLSDLLNRALIRQFTHLSVCLSIHQILLFSVSYVKVIGQLVRTQTPTWPQTLPWRSWWSRIVEVKWSEMKVTQSRLSLCDPMDYIVHGILQARILEWVADPFSRGSSWSRNRTGVSCIAGGFSTNWAIKEAQHLCKVALLWSPF